MLKDILKEKKCFKLVCGAGNESVEEVEKLVFLYSKAGANFFDLCAKPEIVDAAKCGLKKAGIEKDRYLCVSVGIQGDPHVSKYEINQETCRKCGKCFSVCPQGAIIENAQTYKIKRTKCIGCGKCLDVCKHSCITKYSEFVDLKEVLPPIIEKGIDCIELHIMGNNESEILEKWEDINNLYNGLLSICIDRSKLGNEGFINRIKQMIQNRPQFSTIIQADGSPMSGVNDDYKTTLQAISTAEIVQNANLPVYLMLSGGTNSKTAKLAKMCDIDYNGIAIGSYARKIVKPYIDNKDFWNDDEEIIEKGLKIATELVNVTVR